MAKMLRLEIVDEFLLSAEARAYFLELLPQKGRGTGGLTQPDALILHAIESRDLIGYCRHGLGIPTAIADGHHYRDTLAVLLVLGAGLSLNREVATHLIDHNFYRSNPAQFRVQVHPLNQVR